MQQFLLVLAGISFLGASFLLLRRVHEIRTDGVSIMHHHDIYWPFNAIWRFLKETTLRIFKNIYDFFEPHLHKWIGIIAARSFKITYWASYHFLRIHNLVNGRGDAQIKRVSDIKPLLKKD